MFQVELHVKTSTIIIQGTNNALEMTYMTNVSGEEQSQPRKCSQEKQHASVFPINQTVIYRKPQVIVVLNIQVLTMVMHMPSQRLNPDLFHQPVRTVEASWMSTAP